MVAPTILLSAGEPSGDLHGAELVGALKSRWSEARLYGLGGRRMKAVGLESFGDLDKLGVFGIAEALRHIPYHARLLRRLCRTFSELRPDLVLPIDYPGLNLRLARAAHKAGIPVLYYIAPQVWAWHGSRAKQLARYTRELAVILPFEEPLLRSLGMRATFVGHPLLDISPPSEPLSGFCSRLGLEADRPLLALFPGSRTAEVRRHLGVFSAAAQQVQRKIPTVQPVIAASGAVPEDLYEDAPFPRTTDSWALINHAQTALLKSGTSTLEAALAGTPMVIAYKTHGLTYWLARRLVKVDDVGLVNLVAGERLVPEFLQHDASPDTLAKALLPLVAGEASTRHAAIAGLARVRDLLRPEGGVELTVAERVCRLAAELIEV